VSGLGGRQLVMASVVAALALAGVYLALGGAEYEPSPVQDPCESRAWRAPGGIEESAEQFALSALDGAACELRVSRETLAVALASEGSRQAFAEEYGIDDATLEEAVRAGVIRAIDDAEEADALSPLVATPLRAAAANLPVDEGIALIQDASVIFEDAQGLLGDAQGFLDRAF
jgi:hypothetical protein